MAIAGHRPESARPEACSGASENLRDRWRLVLERSGARFDSSGVLDFGEPRTEAQRALHSDVIFDLSDYGLIEVSGDDARKFLASLLTGDVRLVSPQYGQFTSWCDAKGRTQATFWLFLRDGSYVLLLPGTMVEPVLSGLSRYLLRVKVKLRDASSGLLKIGLSGPGAGSGLAACLGADPPLEIGKALQVGDLTLIRIHGKPHPRWLVVGSEQGMAGLWKGLIENTRPAGRNARALLDILAGLPLLVPATAGEFIPQMLDMEALGGLCFTKGCYPGQEVIARLQYRGRLKRRLFLARLVSEKLPAPGANLHGEDLIESAGTVVSAARHPDGGVILLGVVKIEEKNRCRIHLWDSEGPELEFIEHVPG